MKYNKAWLKLGSVNFEELVFWLLHREGFFNVSWYGKHGHDKGRDITCQRTEILGPRVFTSTCVVQCKKYGGRVSRQRLYEDILKASEHKPNYFILATTGIVSASTKDFLASKQEHLGMRVVLWERTDLQILLEHHQDLRKTFLNIPVESEYFVQKIAQEANYWAGSEKIFLTPVVRLAVAFACQSALECRSLVTVAHVLTGLLLKDNECTRSVFVQIGLNPEDVVRILEEQLLEKQPIIPVEHIGLQLSVSLRLGLEWAVRIMKTLSEAIISERILLWALLIERFSGTAHFLEREFHIDLDQVVDSLTSRFFDEEEVDCVDQNYFCFDTRDFGDASS